jgi:hypothetical protein
MHLQAVSNVSKNLPAPSPPRGGLGRGAAHFTRHHPSLTLPVEGREPEEAFHLLLRGYQLHKF